MSLDRDIAQRLQEKYDPGMAEEARDWIEMCLGETLPDDDLMDALTDGTVLCRLLNVVKPGSTKYKVSRMPFVQMENIAKFLDGAKALGVPPFELFQTVDLYEKKKYTASCPSSTFFLAVRIKGESLHSSTGPKTCRLESEGVGRGGASCGP